MKIKFFVASIITLCVVFGVGYGIESLQEANIEYTVVEMTDQGFSPQGVTVSPGTGVRFKNVDVLQHWPATHLHPTHTSYPNSDIRKCGTLEEGRLFDSCRAIEPGEEWTFVFQEIGEWGYHDHLAPQFLGAVTVSPVDGYQAPQEGFFHRTALRLWGMLDATFRITAHAPVRGLELSHNGGALKPSSFFGKFKSSDLESKTDYESVNMLSIAYDALEIRRAVSQLGLQRVMEKLVEDSHEGYTNQCHSEAHYVGHAAYDLLRERAFVECNESCHSGCYHGAMEALFWDVAPSELTQKIQDTCLSLETPFEIFQCFHGSGHGFLAFTGYDVPKALEQCEKLGTREATSSCYGGIFMENVVAGLGLAPGNTGHVTEWLSWDDPLYPCDLYTNNQDAAERCYEMQTSWMLVIFTQDYDKVVDACLGAEESMIPICFRSFGRDVTGNFLRKPEDIIPYCDKVPDPYYPSCIYGAVSTTINFWGSDIGIRAAEFCEAVDKPTGKDACYDRFIERVPFIFATEDAQIEACDTISEEPYHERCYAFLEK